MNAGMLQVAVIQSGSLLFRREATFERVSASVESAASAGAELVVLPEALLGGYPKGLDFGVRIGSRSSAGREEFRRYWDGAIDIPGPETRALRELAAERQVGIVIGAVAHAGNTLLCCTLLFPPNGSEPLVHNKLMPTAGERTIWGAGDGSTMPVMPIDGAIVGSAICWENYMPLFRTAMYAKGVDIWCASTVDDRDTWLATMRHVALEGRCFVLSACQFLRRDGFPSDVHPVQGDRPDTVLIGGGSVIISPLGEIIEGPLRDEEGVLFAHLDLNDLTRARMDFDAVGHYARSDVFQLLVNEQPRRGVDSGQIETLE
jgi:nitrilase